MTTKDIINQINTKGYYIFKNYYTKEHCNKIIKNMKINERQFKGSFLYYNTFSTGGDKRHGNFERLCPLTKKFLEDSKLYSLVETLTNKKIYKKRCMAGILRHDSKRVTNSGGGWHIDNHERQIKSILYLTDVNTQNGPFTYIPGSKHFKDKIKTYKAHANDNSGTRFCEEDLKNKDKIEFTEAAGTCILVDVSNIHRGKVIEKGERYILTNYYYT